jgi:peptide/nickel transport system permease protein
MRLIGRRLALYALTLWVAITVNFLLPHFMPGNPIQTMIGKLHRGGHATRDQRDSALLRRRTQWESALAVLHLHRTALPRQSRRVDHLSASVSSILKAVGAVDDRSHRHLDDHQFLGRYGLRGAARLDARIAPRLADSHATFFQAVPYFFLATVMLLVFASNLHWFPVLGAYSQNLHPGWTGPSSRVCCATANLPVISIVLSSVAGWMLGMRNMMITMVAEDFVLMSIAMGLPKRKVIWAAARNAVLPSIANLSLAIGLVVSGAFLVELVFNYPGVGDLLLNAVQSQDYPLIQGIFLCITLAVLAANLLADLVYLLLDPRTRTEVAP